MLHLICPASVIPMCGLLMAASGEALRERRRAYVREWWRDRERQIGRIKREIELENMTDIQRMDAQKLVPAMCPHAEFIEKLKHINEEHDARVAEYVRSIAATPWDHDWKGIVTILRREGMSASEWRKADAIRWGEKSKNRTACRYY